MQPWSRRKPWSRMFRSANRCGKFRRGDVERFGAESIEGNALEPAVGYDTPDPGLPFGSGLGQDPRSPVGEIPPSLGHLVLVFGALPAG